MDVLVEERTKIRRASACIRSAGVVEVKVPRHWPRDLKRKVTDELVERLCHKDAKEKALLAKHAARQDRITLHNPAELEAYVRQINAETLNVPLGKVRIGYSRYNHLAQVNLRTKTLTVSKYCLKDAPAQALRYLIVHELAHYFEAGHDKKFWALVAAHVPDYRLQSRIMKAFHHQAVIHENRPAETETETAALHAEEPVGMSPSVRPPLPDQRKAVPAARNRHKKETGGWAGFFKQLGLWD